MHPALALPGLKGLSLSIVKALGQSDGLSQVELDKRLRDGRSLSTLSRELKKLMDMGLVAKQGRTRDASFRLTPEAKWWATNPVLRPRVEFDPGRIAAYEPNVTRWMPESANRRMHEARARFSHQMDASTYSKQIAERFLIDLSWASSNLEGNTYDLLDTEVLIKYGDEAAGKDPREATMILNHKQAIAFMLEKFESEPIEIALIKTIHAFLMRDLLSAERVGEIRNDEVRIGGSSYRPSADRAVLGTTLADLLWKAGQVQDPYEASFLILAGTSYIQAFFDGNKRTGRLGCNLPLLKMGLPPMSFLTIDKRAYISGLIAFYELGETSLLADTVASSYEATAPHYAIATAAHRVPRRAELVHRRRIDAELRDFVQLVVDGNGLDPSEFVLDRFSDLPPEEASIVGEAFIAALSNLTETTAPLHGVSRQSLVDYETARSNSSFKP